MGYCTTCGQALEPGNRFCTHCGAKLDAAESASAGTAVQPAPEPSSAATQAPAAPPPQTPPPTYEAPKFYSKELPPPRRIAKPLVIVGLILIVVFAAAYLFLAPKKRTGPAPIVDGTNYTAAPAFQTYGLEKYPGARPVSLPGSDAEQVVAAFETNDTPEQVIGYYRVRFPVAQANFDPAHSTLGAQMNGRQVLVTADALVHGSRVRIGILKPAPPQ